MIAKLDPYSLPLAADESHLGDMPVNLALSYRSMHLSANGKIRPAASDKACRCNFSR